MSGFQFPPPPPPPPTSHSQSRQAHSNEASGYTRGRGRGRGRGRSERDYGQDFVPGGSDQQLRHTRGQAYYPASTYQSRPAQGSVNSNKSISGYTPGQPPPLPAGSYINPNFHQGLQGSNQSNFISNGGDSSYGLYQHGMNSSGSTKPMALPSQIAAGHKRKLDALRGPPPPKQKTAGPPTAPLVPSFGAPLLPRAPSTVQSSNVSGSSVDRIKRSGNALGLTPGTIDMRYSSSESDSEESEADEESLLAATLGPGLTFHDSNGEMRSLNTAADLREWIKERSKNFPTKNRLAEKEAEKRKLGAERNRLLKEAREVLQATMLQFSRGVRERANNAAAPQRLSATASVQPARDDVRGYDDLPKSRRGSEPTSTVVEPLPVDRPLEPYTQCENEASSNDLPAGNDALEPSTADVESESLQNHGDEDVHPTETPQEVFTSMALDTPDLQTQTVEYLGEATRSSDRSSENEGPEEDSSKAPPVAAAKKLVCKFYSASGYCRDGNTCRFRHELSEGAKQMQKQKLEHRRRDPFAPVLDQPAPDSKKTIHQRLMEREQDEEDRLALQVIKYLGSMQFFA